MSATGRQVASLVLVGLAVVCAVVAVFAANGETAPAREGGDFFGWASMLAASVGFGWASRLVREWPD